MKDEIVIIAPELKAGSGGVADYTLRLVEEWGERVQVRFLLPADVERLLEKLPDNGGKVLLQYSAYGFDRLGYPRKLLHTLRDWKRSSGGALVIMFHEIWAFWPWLNKNRFVQWLHRADLGRLIAVADAVFASTPSQVEHLRGLGSARDIQVLPVGSNISPTGLPGGVRKAGLAVLFGLPSSRARARQIMQHDLDALLADGRLTEIAEVGGDTTPEAEISALLSRASFGISAQDPLSLTKSGTFMAYAAHGLNILSPYADPLAAEPLCWLTSPHELRARLSPDELLKRAESLRRWQERTASWPEIAARFAAALNF